MIPPRPSRYVAGFGAIAADAPADPGAADMDLATAGDRFGKVMLAVGAILFLSVAVHYMAAHRG